jgi:CRISPR-associated exonuclease Cas4
MDERWLLVVVIAAVAILLSIAVRSAWRRAHLADRWMPEGLGEASLAYVERTFRSEGPRPVVARVDRAYRSPRGLITLVELKTRAEDRVYASDVIEISAQRLALSSETGEVVVPFGFVVVESNSGRTSKQVKLMSTDQVRKLVDRRHDLLEGRLVPRTPVHARLCGKCTHRDSCDFGRMTANGRDSAGAAEMGRGVLPL